MTSPHRYFHLLVLNWSYLKRVVYIFIPAILALLISLLDRLEIRILHNALSHNDSFELVMTMMLLQFIEEAAIFREFQDKLGQT